MVDIKTICFWICIACLFSGVLVSILAVWGAVGGDAVWKMLTTVGIMFGGACGLAGTCAYFGYGQPPKS